MLGTPAHQAKRLQSELLNLYLLLETGALGGDADCIDINIIGGGATGVELAAEMREAIEQFSQKGIDRLGDIDIVRIRVVEAAPRVLSALSEEVSKKVARHLGELSIDLLTEAGVSRLEVDAVHLADGMSIPSTLTIWAAGIETPGLTSTLDTPQNGSLGRLCVRPTLQSTLDDSIYVIDDCAECPWPEKETALPPRAQVAAHLDGKTLADFHYVDRGSLVVISQEGAVAALMGKAIGTVTFEG